MRRRAREIPRRLPGNPAITRDACARPPHPSARRLQLVKERMLWNRVPSQLKKRITGGIKGTPGETHTLPPNTDLQETRLLWGPRKDRRVLAFPGQRSRSEHWRSHLQCVGGGTTDVHAALPPLRRGLAPTERFQKNHSIDAAISRRRPPSPKLSTPPGIALGHWAGCPASSAHREGNTRDDAKCGPRRNTTKKTPDLMSHESRW